MPETVRWPRRLANTGYLAALARVERSVPFWPRERIERLQRRRLRAIVCHAYATVPFYRRAMDERGLRPADFRTVADLAKLPLIDGEFVRRNTEHFASSRYGDGSRQAFYTSGSRSHVRKLIWWDDAAVLRKLAVAERDRTILTKLAGQGWGQRQLLLFLPGSDIEQVRGFWDARTLTFRRRAERLFVDPSLPIEAVAARLAAFRPHVVFSTGAFIEHLCRSLVDRGIAVPAPRVWVYGGTTLSPAGRELIERDLGGVVYSTYQATETGRLGFQCERREGFHLNVDLVAARVVDGAGQDVAPGEAGEVVVSNLHNRATVLLNYRLEDWAVLAARPCPCGRSLPVLERLEGRTGEMVVLADGRALSSLGIESLFGDALGETLKAQVVHPAPGLVRWRVVPFARADREALRRGLVERGREALGDGTRVEVEFVDEIPSTPLGKFRRVVGAGERG